MLWHGDGVWRRLGKLQHHLLWSKSLTTLLRCLKKLALTLSLKADICWKDGYRLALQLPHMKKPG